MKIDLHVHTKERSACATIGENAQILAAIGAGLDAIAITDHNRLVPAPHLEELRVKYAPFQVFTGIEVDADSEHWLVLGVSDPALEVWGWHYPELRDFVQQRGGAIILAHPYRHHPEINADLERLPPDGIEYRSFNTPTDREADILALAERLGMAAFSNSDSHFEGTLGKYYTLIPSHASTDAELVAEIQRMKVVGRQDPCLL